MQQTLDRRSYTNTAVTLMLKRVRTSDPKGSKRWYQFPLPKCVMPRVDDGDREKLIQVESE